jgi:hypothetical protein
MNALGLRENPRPHSLLFTFQIIRQKRPDGKQKVFVIGDTCGIEPFESTAVPVLHKKEKSGPLILQRGSECAMSLSLALSLSLLHTQRAMRCYSSPGALHGRVDRSSLRFLIVSRQRLLCCCH